MLLEIESSQGAEVKTLARSYYPLSKVHILKDLIWSGSVPGNRATQPARSHMPAR